MRRIVLTLTFLIAACGGSTPSQQPSSYNVLLSNYGYTNQSPLNSDNDPLTSRDAPHQYALAACKRCTYDFFLSASRTRPVVFLENQELVAALAGQPHVNSEDPGVVNVRVVIPLGTVSFGKLSASEQREFLSVPEETNVMSAPDGAAVDTPSGPVKVRILMLGAG